MGDIFYKVLEMSIYGSLAIIAVLLFRLVFQKCPKRIMILFWIIVGLRLTLPFNFNSPTSALNFGKLFQPKVSVTETSVYDPETRLREMTTEERVIPAETAVVTGESMSGNEQGNVAVQTAAEAPAPKVTAKTVIPYIWFAVMLGLLIFSAVRYAIFYSKARWSSRSFDGRYYMANDIDSPFVVGIFSPKIFFPINMDDDEREYVLNHEWTHIKNKDGLTKLLSYIVLCIHWFNPLVWLAFFMLCADIEMRVDEETTSNFSLSMVKEYCKSLVRHAADDNKGAFMQSTAFSGLSFGGMETKIRIKNLLNNKITSRAVQITSIAVTMVFALLISAASIDHQRGRKAPAVAGQTETSASDPTDKAVSDWDNGFIDAYKQLIISLSGDRNDRFNLIYINDDLIPELVYEDMTTTNSKVSLYTYADGTVKTVFLNRKYDGADTDTFFYVPEGDFIVNQVSNTGGEDCYHYSFSLESLMNGSSPEHTGHYTFTECYFDDEEISREELTLKFNTKKLQRIEGKYDEVTALGMLDSLRMSKDHKISSDNANTTALSEITDITTEPSDTEMTETEATTETTSETTVPSPTPVPVTSVKIIDISKIKDFTVTPFKNEANNYSYSVSGSFGYVIVRFVPENNTVLIYVNDKEFEFAVPTSTTNGIYLLKDYGKANIYIQFMISGGNQIGVFNLTDEGVTFRGALKNSTFERAVDNPRTFWIIENYGDNALVDVYRNYEMSKQDGMPVPNDYMMTLFDPKMKLRAKGDLSGYRIQNGRVYKDQIVSVKAGDILIPLRTDENKYIQVRTAEGVDFQIDFTSQRSRFYDKNNVRWIYYAIEDWFEPVR